MEENLQINILFFLLEPVVTQDGVFILDMAAKIDATADFICKAKWGDVEFPPPFGREAYPEVRAEKSFQVFMFSKMTCSFFLFFISKLFFFFFYKLLITCEWAKSQKYLMYFKCFHTDDLSNYNKTIGTRFYCSVLFIHLI